MVPHISLFYHNYITNELTVQAKMKELVKGVLVIWSKSTNTFGFSERLPFYYTDQVCELDEFGLQFGFFVSGCKSRYQGILDCLNFKASISQKKFF